MRNRFGLPGDITSFGTLPGLVNASGQASRAPIARLAHRVLGPGHGSGAAPSTGDGTLKTYSVTLVNESGRAIEIASLVLQGWALTTTGTSVPGNSFTVNGNIEYPVGGTTTAMVVDGDPNLVVPSTELLVSTETELATVIPDGASFKVNLSSTIPNGLKYIANLGFAGVRTHALAAELCPIALFAVGDSIMTNNGGAAYAAASGKCPVYQTSIAGTTALAYGDSNAANFAKQAELASVLGCTHVISNFGTNDFGSGRSKVTTMGYLEAMRNKVQAYGIKFVQCTMLPRTSRRSAVTALSVTRSGNVMTVELADTSLFTVGMPYTFAGSTDVAYNGTKICTGKTATTLTFPIFSSTTTPAPGTITLVPWKETVQAEWMQAWAPQFDPGPTSERGLFNAQVRDGVTFDDYIEWADACEPERDSGRWLVAGESELLPTMQEITVSSVISTSRFNSNYNRGSSTIANGFVQAKTGGNIGTYRAGNGNTNGDITVTSAWPVAQAIGDVYYAMPGVSYMSDDGTHPRVAGGGKGGQPHIQNPTAAKIDEWLLAA